jgi:hypothetical protein
MKAMLTVSAVPACGNRKQIVACLFSIPWVAQERQRHLCFNSQRIEHSDIASIFAVMHVFGGTLYPLDIGL